MSTFSKDHASSSCSSSTAANALRQLRGDEEEGGVRDMRNAKVDIFSRLFVGLGLCLAFRVNAQQLLLIISNAARQFVGTLDFKNEDDSTTKIHDIEHGAMQPSTEQQTSEDARESSPLTDERISDNGTVQMLPNSTVQTNINNGEQQNAVNGLLSRGESTTENRTFGFEINPSTPWLCMPWIMAAVIILLGLLVPFL
ncbi:hypothetical protein MRB53_013188 [Persea americana]|uniref:Uncharacterized protein n=1 Tax=Persea americana TaxID=3435 RepID=A0ACC2K7N3_PERAE|nr:hypothetical protein MRB53_013188 [Persea americana]